MDPFPRIAVKLLHPDAKLPSYSHRDDAAADLSSIENVTIPPGHRALIGCGIAFAIPEGWMVEIASRSGLAVKKGAEKGAGIIDEGYTGEIKVLLHNFDPYADLEVRVGDRIGQMLVRPYWQAGFDEVEELPTKTRGAAGFGSTGQ